MYRDPVTGPVWPRGWVEVLLYSSMTAALEGGEWSAARPGRTLPPGKTRYPFYKKLGGPQGRSGRAKNLDPTRIRSRTVHPVVSRYTDWATGSNINNIKMYIKIYIKSSSDMLRCYSYTIIRERIIRACWSYSCWNRCTVRMWRLSRPNRQVCVTATKGYINNRNF